MRAEMKARVKTRAVKEKKKSAGARDEGIATSKGRTGAVFRPGSSVY